MSVLQIGAGGVGWVIAHKCAQNNDVLGDITIASRTLSKCEKIITSIKGRNNLKDPRKSISAKTINADDVEALIALINQVQPDLLINAGPPWVNVAIMEACVQTKTAYLDTSVATDLCSPGQQVPEAYDPQWAFADRFKEAGITGILGAGFDPGVVSVFATYAHKHLFDEIDSIDVMDVNAGDHGQKFATNFDPETNMLEIQGDSFYYENGEWNQVPCHSRMMEFDFPVVGKQKVYSMAHDEVRDTYLNYFNVMRDIGLLNTTPITTVDGITVEPLKVLKAILPDPTSLASGYTGKTCIGTWLRGKKDGVAKSVFIYNICDHKASYNEVEHQAISYTTGVPAITAALLYFQGKWSDKGLYNVEQLNPDHFLELMPTIGLTWEIMELDAE